MARKRSNQSNNDTRSYISQDAMDALVSGKYGEFTGRQAKYRTSQEQTMQGKELPTFISAKATPASTTSEWQSSFGKAQQYQQNLENEANKYTWNEETRKNNTLDKDDFKYLQKYFDEYGDSARTKKALYESKQTQNWEQKYGKSKDQIYADFLADQGNVKLEKGKEHPILTEISTMLGNVPQSLFGTLPSLVANAIAPDTKFAKGAENLRARNEENRRYLRAGVKENTGETGDKVIDTINQVGDRMVNTALGSAIAGHAGGGVMAGLSEANRKMEDLNLRPDMSSRRKALSALAYGTEEGIGTAITGGILDGLPVVNGVGGKLLNIGKAAGNAAIENAITEAIEMGTDTLINGENSEKELNKALYMMQGMSEAEAEEQAQNDQWDRVKGAAGTGALFGGFTKGLGEALDSAKKIPALKGLFGDTEPEAKAKPRVSSLDNMPKAPEVKNTNVEVPNTAKVPEGIQVYRGYNRSDNNVKVTPAETAPNEPLPVEDSGVVPPGGNIPPNGNVPPEPPKGPETDISQRYETLKNSDLFQKSQANMKMLETAKEQGIFNKDIEGRAKAQADALKEFTDDPTKAINDNLNGQWTSGKDLDTSMLVLNDALDSGSQAYANLVMLKQAQQTKQAGRILRAALDYAKRNYAGTKEGTLQEAAKFLNDKAEAVLSSRKTAEQFNAIAERIMNGDLSDLSTRFNMDDVNIQNIKDALEAGAGKADIAHMIAMYQSVGKTGISAEALQKITDIYNTIQAQNLEPNSRARANLETDAFKVLAQDIGGKRTFKEQWDAWRYLAMLGNPKTHLRNLLGNTTHYMVTEAKDNIGAIMEAAIDKANKAAGGEGIDRTKSVLTAKDKGLIQAGELDADNVAYAALNDSGNKYNVKNEIDRARASFNNKALSKVDALNSNLLDLEDYSALKRKYSKSLARFLKANGADESIFKATDEASKALLDKGRAYAIDQAKQATFHEYSKVAAMLSRFSNDMANSDKLRHKAGAWMLEGLLPFKKTPINILKQGGKYSPISLATGLKKAFDAVQTGNSTAAEAIEDLSAGITGTGIMGLGMFLAHEGFLTGSANPDYTVDQAETEQGAQNYALKIGDNSYTLDWLAPMSLPLFVGVELNKLMNEDDDEGLTINKAISALSTIAEPITEMSMLQGINDVLEKLSYDPAGALAGLATQTGLGYITQGVPTIAGQVARAADDTRRSTYSENTGAEKQLDKALMKVQNKIPFLSRSSQPYVTASGQEQKNEGLASYKLGDNFGTRLIDQMLSPGYFKQGTISETDKELNRLYEATGESPYMNVLSGKVDGQQLGKESFTSYQKLYGSNNDYLYDEIIKSDQYKNLDDAEKVKALKSIRDTSKMIADHEIGGKELEKSEQKVYDIYKSKGKEGLLQYFKDKATADSLGMNYDSYIKKESEAPGSAEQWMVDKDNALNMGFTNKDGTVNVESYENAVEMFGNDLPALQSYSEYKSQGFKKNSEKIPYLMDNDSFTDEQKGMILAGNKTYDDLGNTARGAYDIDGYAGVYYYWLLKQIADTDGNGSIKKAEREALLNSDNPYVTQLSDDMYYYLAGAKW